MNINLDEVGAAATKDGAGHWQVHVGIYLPGITFNKGYRVRVRVIHERDQFVRGIEPKAFDLSWHNGSALDLWDTTVDLTANADGNFGQEGTYLYRFQLLRGSQVVTVWFSDPFGRATGRGTLSTFTIDSNAQPFAWSDGRFLVPEVDDLVVYEMHVGEFNDTFGGVVAQVDYLTSLGVNALELMPVTNVKEDVEWGYTPLSYARRPLRRPHGDEATGQRLPPARHRGHPGLGLCPRPPRVRLQPGLRDVRRAQPHDGPVRGGVLLATGHGLQQGVHPRILLHGQPILDGGVPRRRIPVRLRPRDARRPRG